MIQLNFLGSMNTIEASGILVDTGVEKFVLDYGADVEHMPPKPPLPVKGKIDAILLSHAHLDHSGSIPILVKPNGCSVYAHVCTKDLTELLLLDSAKISMIELGDIEEAKLPFTKQDVKNTMKKFVNVDYRVPFKLHKTEITYFDAGHIPGSAMINLNFDGKNLLFVGNYNTIDTRLLEGCDKDLPKIDYLITECTYSDRNHPDRMREEKALVNLVNDTVANNGIALISGFAVGRLQEVLLILDHYGIDYPIYIDGMAKKATTIVNKHKNLLREPKSLDKALEKVKYVASERLRRKIIRQPCVILTTAGMLQAGPVVWYIKKLYDDRNSSLIMSGFQMENTPGKILLDTGRFVTKDLNLDVSMFVKRFDFSAHLGRKELFEFIDLTNPEKVFCVHGEKTEEFTRELKEKGFDAIAPVVNNRIFNLD